MQMPYLKCNTHQADVLIIGSGGAALFSAYLLAKNLKSSKICIASSFEIGTGATLSAKGGINAALANITEDKWQWHAFDTIKAGQGLCNTEVVNYTCRLAPRLVKIIDKLGVDFDKGTDGKILQRKYGGQRLNNGEGDFAYRACFKSDTTGASIVKALKNNVFAMQNVKCFSGLHLIKIEAAAAGASGAKTATRAYFTNLYSNEIVIFNFNHLILASGGYSGVYSSATSGGAGSAGVHALMHFAGAELKDVEFVQFHPTGLYPCNILVSEACRGEGGYLETEDGDRFLRHYSPQNMELSSRDVISKAIFTQMQKDSKDFMYLNLSHLGRNFIKTKLANAFANAEFFCGIDLSKQPIKVRPVAHYAMGGLEVDTNYGLKNFTNVFCVGEAACASLHGANRLGCNSLLELLTSSFKACIALKKQIKHGQDCKLSWQNQEGERINIEQITTEQVCKVLNIAQGRAKIGKLSTAEALDIELSIKVAMDKYLGIVKNEDGIRLMLYEIGKGVDIFASKTLVVEDVIDANIFFNAAAQIAIARQICLASLKRCESRGSFVRSDFPLTYQDAQLSSSINTSTGKLGKPAKINKNKKQIRGIGLKQNLQRRKSLVK